MGRCTVSPVKESKFYELEKQCQDTSFKMVESLLQ